MRIFAFIICSFLTVVLLYNFVALIRLVIKRIKDKKSNVNNDNSDSLDTD